jgi:hypothetical protein
MENAVSVSSGYNHSIAIKTDGSTWVWGDNILGQLGDGTTETRTVPIEVTFCDVTVVLNGKQLNFVVQPKIINGQTLVPLRSVFEELGVTVAWCNDTKTVTAIGNNTIVILTVGNNLPTINGVEVYLDQPGSVIYAGRVLVPLRFISEAFGAVVEWDSITRTVHINTEN